MLLHTYQFLHEWTMSWTCGAAMKRDAFRHRMLNFVLNFNPSLNEFYLRKPCLIQAFPICIYNIYEHTLPSRIVVIRGYRHNSWGEEEKWWFQISEKDEISSRPGMNFLIQKFVNHTQSFQWLRFPCKHVELAPNAGFDDLIS